MRKLGYSGPITPRLFPQFLEPMSIPTNSNAVPVGAPPTLCVSDSLSTAGLSFHSNTFLFFLFTEDGWRLLVAGGAFCALCLRCAQRLYRTMPNLHSGA